MVSQSIFVKSQKKYYDAMFTQESYRARLASQSEMLLPILRALNWVKSKALTKAKVLDVGCGTGSFLNLIQDKISDTWQYSGIDISEVAIAQGKSLFPDLKLALDDGSKTKYESNSFDMIVSYGSLEHFYNPGETIKEIARILKPKGYFFLMMSGVNKMKDDNDKIGEITVPPHTSNQTQMYLRRPDGNPAQIEINNLQHVLKKGFGSVSNHLIEIDSINIEHERVHNHLNSNEGWDRTGQPQWNLNRSTWYSYLNKYGLGLWNESTIAQFKPRHIHPFFFGEK